MERLSDPAVIKRILSEAGFSFKKSLGQNFLIDGSVCPEMASAACEDGEKFALEIGPGIGVLTAELARCFERVTAIELDERLRPVLKKTLSFANNTEIVFGDAMEAELVAKPFEIKDEKTGNVFAGNSYAVQTVDENGEIYECAIKPYRSSDKTLINMLLR